LFVTKVLRVLKTQQNKTSAREGDVIMRLSYEQIVGVICEESLIACYFIYYLFIIL